ncbi:MAG TPA: HAD family hydrolase [Thermoplasmata archaeon]|nr:HAD family hydrolase [Thermoplasmata archaeon]
MARTPHVRVQAVFFDLGGTLLDFRDPERWAQVASEVGLPIEPEHLGHAVEEAEAKFDGPGRDPRIESMTTFWGFALSRGVGSEVPVETVERFIERWRRDRLPGHLFSDVPRCLEELRGERRRLGVISNSRSEEWLGVALNEFGIADQFEVLVSSGTEGVAKPDRAIFDRAARRLGVQNAAAFHVGDLAYTDATAARAAGFHSVWLNRRGTGFGDDPPEITSLTELPGFIRDLEGRSR